MFCKYCGEKLPEDSQCCTVCQNSTEIGTLQLQNKKNKNRIFKTAAVIVFLIFIISAAVFFLINVFVKSYKSINEASLSSYSSNSLQSKAFGESGSYGSESIYAKSGIYGTDTQIHDLRDFYSVVLGDNNDKWTVMIYMIGSDLESESAMATFDLVEMIKSDLGENVNLIVQTGGTKKWQNNVMDNNHVQRFKIADKGLYELDDLGKNSMTESYEVLSDFISFCSSKYPANRYALIFWDHGGGPVYGFGNDETDPENALSLNDIKNALDASALKFDFIGFDACLMGSLETAYMLEPYADYLIASEETVPGFGWNYTEWLNFLSANTSADTLEIGIKIVDSFVEQNTTQDTLSVISLREVPALYNALCEYMKDMENIIFDNRFSSVSAARSNTKSFNLGQTDMIDLGDFIYKTDGQKSDSVLSVLNSAVKYRNNCSVKGVNGISMYFPYMQIDEYEKAKEEFNNFGYGGELFEFYDTFLSIIAKVQKSSNSRSLFENMTGSQEDTNPDLSSNSWYIESMVDIDQFNLIDYNNLNILWDDNNGYNYIPLTEDDWESIASIELQIMIDDGKGYIDLGSDQYYETDDNGNLIFNYIEDNSWVSINGQIVPYYAEEITELGEDDFIFTGTVPAILNDETDIELILIWDGADSNGYVAGYRLVSENNIGTVGKGLRQFKPEDKINFICDYYTYDGDYEASYLFGTQIVFEDELSVEYIDIGEYTILQCYMITDIYQNKAWTDTVIFTH